MDEDFKVRRAVSSTVIAVVVVIVLVVAAAGAYLALGMGGGNKTTSSSSTTTSSTSGAAGPSEQSLNSSVQQFVLDFNNRDVTSIKNYFTSTSAISWTGSAGGLQGTYSGIDGAGIVYATSVGHTTSMKATESKLNILLAGSTGTVGYHLNITGVSNVIGKFNTTADVSQVWVYQSGAWTVQTDDWNYLSFSSNNPSQATVFPQWGLTLNGQPPSLAGEHVLEWNVAPYLALAIYVSIVAIGVALIWAKVRKGKR